MVYFDQATFFVGVIVVSQDWEGRVAVPGFGTVPLMKGLFIIQVFYFKRNDVMIRWCRTNVLGFNRVG